MPEFIFGLVFGSFLNVLIWRLNDPEAPKFWQGKSLCPKCRHPIAWHDNIPLLSYILLLGRCRHCRKKISLQYPAVELVTAVTFWLIGLNPLLLGIASCLIVIFFSDLKYGLIPDEMILVALAAFLGYQFSVLGFQQTVYQLVSFQLQSPLIIALLSSLFFLIFYFLKMMGFGDVKLAFLMGLLLGWPKIIVAFWVAFVSGGLVAVILLALRRTKLSATMVLGPFLVIGTLVAALWTNELLAAVGIP